MTNTVPWGIEERYEDGLKQWRHVSSETKRALLDAMDADELHTPEEPALRIVTEGSDEPLPSHSEIELEDGSLLRQDVAVSELPLGYHTLRDRDSEKQIKLIVAPKSCYLRERFRVWGWTLQLYAMRSKESWGIGDLEDLRQFAAWSADVLSAGVVMTSPLGAASPSLPQQSSPYYPSSRLFRNPLYLRIEEVPGARESLPDLEQYTAQGRALNEAELIDRNAIYELKMNALERIWAQIHDKVKSTDYEQAEDSKLELFAAFCSLAECYGSNWCNWPPEYQHPDSPALRNPPPQLKARAQFHKWIQWLLDGQLLRACERGTIMQDLPVGVDPSGADAWIWQDVFARNIRVGAPPDPFSETGQDWGLPPFIPHRLRAAGYEPFIQTLRSAMGHSAGLRIDHVMGLFRLFWIPAGASPQAGAYVRYNADEMLAILALESARAKAFVVGEDLGTVEPGVREKLAKFGVLSYRVLWFEENPPSEYPELSLASIGTHDLPTIAGVWSGADFEEQKQVGLKPNKEVTEKSRKQIQTIAGVDATASMPEVIVKAHEALAEAPSVISLASLDDALAVERRPNLPGTLEEQRPNWSIPLPKRLEEIETEPRVLEIAHILQRSVMKRSAVPNSAKPSTSQLLE